MKLTTGDREPIDRGSIAGSQIRQLVISVAIETELEVELGNGRVEKLEVIAVTPAQGDRFSFDRLMIDGMGLSGGDRTRNLTTDEQ